jgi:hypothetical protein
VKQLAKGKRTVSTESRNGTTLGFPAVTSFVKASIQLPRDDNDLLIVMSSLACSLPIRSRLVTGPAMAWIMT